MFVDKAKINVKGGAGGDGIVSFRREKYVEQGGPAGGDGGRGGSVIFRVDEGLRTLVDFKYQKHFKADRGERGGTKTMHGANAENMIVRIPPGTVIINDDTQEIIADLTRHGQEVVVARGGRGGRGNTRFASPSTPAPYIAEKGEEGDERWIVLELKVMADVGLVGFPSVGKSTLLSVVSGARPKIGAYHFTTITPNLGVVDVGNGKSFVMADLPGLIEGAHEGVGLGHEFLRHVERTRVILHVIDMAATDGRDPYEDYVQINEELRLYNAKLSDRPQIVAANKMDMPESAEHLIAFKEKMQEAGHGDVEIFEMSTVTKQGVQEALYRLAELLDTIAEAPVVEEVSAVEERKIYKMEPKGAINEFTIRRENEMYVVESSSLENFINRYNLNQEDVLQRFATIMRRMGVENELRSRGAVDGTIVRIGSYEFEFVEYD
ncbi:GTPase ObgE [Paenibacillus swuensis]|uniref:GTPase Obg n=1 Tax=Paenibacillus swuensis TaxID=1178515 RepID=A0A172TJI9_9BACL|nr:GTPase ObgE [Paenibacillus swuensis]ANE47180.1 GTPase ObgE [Paenibacillus swuensis]